MLPVISAFFVLILAYKVWLPSKFEILDADRTKIFLYVASLMATLVWLICRFPLLISSSYTPDEAWFVYEVVVRNNDQGGDSLFWWFNRYFAQANLFGYGGLWWGVYSFVLDLSSMIFPPAMKLSSELPGPQNFRTDFLSVVESGNAYMQFAMWVMRSLALSVAAIFMLRLCRRILKEPLAALGAVLLLTMPMMYWSGKLASPEYFGAFLLLISVFEYFESRNPNWFLLSGIACGAKLTCAPVAAILLIYGLLVEWRKGGVKCCFLLGGRFLIGLLLVNLYFIFHPVEFVANLLKFSSLFSAAPWRLSFMYGPLPFWEGGTYGNLSYWYGSIYVFFAVVVVSVCASPKLGLWLLLAAVAMFLFMLTQPLHNWYWFPVILASVIPLSFATVKGKLYRATLAVGVGVLICINLKYSVGNINSEIGFKVAHISEYQSFDVIQPCVDSIVMRLKPNKVYDMAMIGKIIKLPLESHHVSYPESFSSLPNIQDLSASSDSVAFIGPRAAAVGPITNFIERVLDSGAEHGMCGKTLWVKF